MHANEGGAYTPRALTTRLKSVAKHLRIGRQEDAHEFLRLLLDRVHLVCLSGQGVDISKMTAQTPGPGRLYETSYIYKAFGGYLRNQLHCPHCGYDSNTFDAFLDLSLEVGARRGITSVEKALAVYTRPEALDKANKWKCPRCQAHVCAVKQLTIRKAPAILTVQLKRFSFMSAFGGFGMGGKIQDHISFPFVLDIAPALSDSAKAEGTPSQYDLYAFIVHHGGGAHSGHYYAFVQSQSGEWMCMDDCSVSRVGLHVVKQQQAYVLFYKQRQTAAAPVATAVKAATEIVSAMDELEAVQWTGGRDASAPAPRVVIGTSASAALPDALFNTATADTHTSPPIMLDFTAFMSRPRRHGWFPLSDSMVCPPRPLLAALLSMQRQRAGSASSSDSSSDAAPEPPTVKDTTTAATVRAPAATPLITAAPDARVAAGNGAVRIAAAETARVTAAPVVSAAGAPAPAAPAPVAPAPAPPPRVATRAAPVAAPRTAPVPTPTVATVLYADAWGDVGGWGLDDAPVAAGMKRPRASNGTSGPDATDREWNDALDAGRTKKVKGPAPDRASLAAHFQGVHDAKRRETEARKRNMATDYSARDGDESRMA